MSEVNDAAKGLLVLNWLLFSGMLAYNHARVRTRRRQLSIPEEKPAIRDPRSMHGLFLEAMGFAIVAVFARGAWIATEVQCVVSMVTGVLAVGVLWAALRHLGLEWRIKAVVTEDHKLVTSGPYGVIRHPIFTALTCLLVSTTVLVNPWWASALALGVSMWGTEIRVQAEDGLLEQRFGEQFREYQRRVAAYFPGVR